MQAVIVIQADIQGGGVERTVHGCRKTEEGSRSRILISCRAVSGVIVGFHILDGRAADASSFVDDSRALANQTRSRRGKRMTSC
jgi:hypothetical protein